MINAIRLLRRPIRFYHANFSECLCDVWTNIANQNTTFAPRSPYAVAKTSAHWLVANYCESYVLHPCKGILFNQESPLRSARFVTQTIFLTACSIARFSGDRLTVGRLDIVRDWGWAPKYVEAMWRMLQQSVPRGYVFATGLASTLVSFVSSSFECLDMDWHQHMVPGPKLFRPIDLSCSQGDLSLVARELGWS